MRDDSFAVMRRVGVETGGSNVQFAVDPSQRSPGRYRDEPTRVSRSSRWHPRPPGFPIAKIAARLAVGYTLDEIPNDITEKTPASFEPTIDYVVTKVPRWNFEKFPGTPPYSWLPDASGWRGHGDRAYLHRVAAEGTAIARTRPLGPQL